MVESCLQREIGTTGLRVPPLGFGAFKIGRNEGIKYPTGYELPDLPAVRELLQGILNLGCRYIDTAPAYGVSEERLGCLLPDLLATLTDRDAVDRTAVDHAAAPLAPCVISTKVGETFENGQSTYDYSRAAVLKSLERSRQRLQRDVLDLVFIHSHGADLEILQQTDVAAVLQAQREQGRIRAIGFSGKTPEGTAAALDWADAVMVEYHSADTSHAAVMDTAAERGTAVIVKKGLASGRLPAAAAIRFVLSHPAVTSLVVGGLSLTNFRTNWHTAMSCTNSDRDCG